MCPFASPKQTTIPHAFLIMGCRILPCHWCYHLHFWIPDIQQPLAVTWCSCLTLSKSGKHCSSDMENIAWTTWSFNWRTVRYFQRRQITEAFEVFTVMFHSYAKVLQSTAKKNTKDTACFRVCLELFESRPLRHTRIPWMVSRLLTKSQ